MGLRHSVERGCVTVHPVSGAAHFWNTQCCIWITAHVCLRSTDTHTLSATLYRKYMIFLKHLQRCVWITSYVCRRSTDTHTLPLLALLVQTLFLQPHIWSTTHVWNTATLYTNHIPCVFSRYWHTLSFCNVVYEVHTCLQHRNVVYASHRIAKKEWA